MADAAGAISRELARPRRVFVFTHIRPDGDAVGSGLALGAILREAGHDPEVILAEHMPRRYLFLKGSGAARRASEVAADAGAVAFSLDASEMIWRLAKEMGWSVPPAARDALYVAIMTDTGRFTFGNTTSGSLEVAAALVRSGASPEILAEEVYGHRTPAQWELERRARASLRFEHDGTVATLELTMRDFDETGTTPGDTDQFASLPRRQAGVEVGLFFYEIDDGARTKIGIRTSRRVDANVLAARLGGGGHRRAAGCTVDGPLDDVREKVLAETFRFLEGR
jgi:phosphoesterase RecJ-like protein